MIGLDTNVLVRYIAQDHPQQSASATRLIESLTEDSPGFVSLVAVVELHWVLRRRYGVSRKDSTAVLRRLLDAAELVVQDSELLRRVLSRLGGTVDLPDALVAELGTRAGCQHTLTFDRRAAGALDELVLLSSR